MHVERSNVCIKGFPVLGVRGMSACSSMTGTKPESSATPSVTVHTIPVSSSTGWLKRRSMTFRGIPRRPTICWEEFYLPLLFPSWLRGLACASPEPFEGTDSGSSNSSGALPSAHRWLPLGVPPASVLCADFSLPPRAVGLHPAPPWFGEIRRLPATAHCVTRSSWMRGVPSPST